MFLRVALAAVFCVVSASAAWAGAWTLRRGETQIFVASSFTYGDHGFDDDGDLVTVPDYQKFNLSAALEYGLRPWLTAIVKGELVEERVEHEVLPDVFAPAPQTFASVGGGARVRLFQGPSWVVSSEALVYSGGFTTTGSAKPADGPALEMRILGGVGGEVMGTHVFADAQFGYRARLEDEEPDEVKVDLTLGAQVLPNWMLLAQTFSTFQVDGDQSFHKVSGSVVRTVTERLRVEVGAVATVAGRNAVREIGGHLSFWYTLPPKASTRERAGERERVEEIARISSIFK